eukprot:2671340-Amphidinium_carterae.1
MHCLHAALASSTNAPIGCVWTHQVHDALCWFQLFLKRAAGSLERTYYLSAWWGWGPPWHIQVDASPWGFG